MLTRVVIDTNLIIAGRWSAGSDSAKILELCLDGKILPVFSEKTRNENMWILEKVKPSPEYLQKVKVFFTKAEYVMPTQRIDICSDKSDNLYFEAALAGGARFIITNDRHLLEHNGYMGVKVLRPGEFLKEFREAEVPEKESGEKYWNDTNDDW
jgi:putative PIN family toxin of toxin-antitoxin system